MFASSRRLQDLLRFRFPPAQSLGARTVDGAGNVSDWSGDSNGITVDTVGPTVVSVTPEPDATIVSVNTPVTVEFSEAVDPDTVNEETFLVKKGGFLEVYGEISVDGATATFTPSTPLAYDSSYTATIKADVTDVLGHPMTEDYAWSFTTTANLGKARNENVDRTLAFGPAVVSAVFPSSGCVYVEAQDRSAGIRVDTSESLSVGDIVNVKGDLSTDWGIGERYVQADEGWPQTIGSGQAILALGMRNQWIGGGSPSAVVPPLLDGFGAYNEGLLVQTWGRVTYCGAGYFYVDDGSALWDKSLHVGLRVKTPADLQQPPAEGDFVLVRGISGATSVTFGNAVYQVRMIVPRDSQDITVVSLSSFQTTEAALCLGENWLGLTAIPYDPDPEDVFVACDGYPPFSIAGHLVRFDSISLEEIVYSWCGETNAFGKCLLSEGYGLYTHGATRMCYVGIPAPGDQWISMPNSCWIASPYSYAVPWAACLVTDTATTKTIEEALTAGWISEVYYYDYGCGTWQTISSFATSSIEPGRVYVPIVQRPNIALIMPAQQ